MNEEGFSLRVAGWIMDAYTSFVITPGGEIDRLPTLVIYADEFMTVRRVPLAVASRPVPITVTRELAGRKQVLTLGEHLTVTGRVTAVNVASGRQQQAVRQTREKIAALDQNHVGRFKNGLWRIDRELAKVAALRRAYLRGELDLDTLQNQENRIFAREGRGHLRQLALLHDEQLAIRRRALPELLAHSHVTYQLTHPSELIVGPWGRSRQVKPRRRTAEDQQAIMRLQFEPIGPKVALQTTRTVAGRANYLVPLQRFRQYWLNAGRPVALLPKPAWTLAAKQAAWLAYEAQRAGQRADTTP